jgi:hypothetical protein
MKTLDLTGAFGPLAGYVQDLNQEPVALMVDGKPVAVLIPVYHADLETVSLSVNPKFLAIIEDSRRRYYTEGGLSPEEVRRELGLPPESEGDKVNSRKSRTKAKSDTKRRKVNVNKKRGGADGSQV